MKKSNLQLDHDHIPKTLAWEGDRLVDVAGGELSVDLAGVTTPRRISWGYPFDRALVSASSGTRVLYELTGTKGLVARADEIVRELNRSCYHANAYEFPVDVAQLEDGREVIAHCPDGYNRIAIEMLDSGERLASPGQGSVDVFHSRLRFSPDGRYLLSAGWFWHPFGVVRVFDVELALDDSSHLGGHGLLDWDAVDAEVEAACWMSSSSMFICGEPNEDPLNDDGHGLRPGEIGIWSVNEREWISRRQFGKHTGTVHRLGDKVLCLFEHPRLLDPSSAQIIAEWPELNTGKQTGSIIFQDRPPPFALDEAHRRFAVAQGHDIVVVEVD